MRKLIMFWLMIGVSPVLLAQPVPAPEFSVSSTAGQLKLSQQRGKIVYVDFWASWCVPCRKSFPWLNQMQSRYGPAGLKIIAINLDEDTSLAEQFLRQYPAAFTVGFDPKGISAKAYKLRGMPSSYLIDRNGNLLSTHVGFRSDDQMELEQKIRRALGK